MFKKALVDRKKSLTSELFSFLRLPVIIGSFLLFFSLFSSSALALGTGGVGGYPANPDPSIKYSDSWFIYSLDLGESKDDALLVFNTSDEAHVVKLYPVDSIPSNQGNFALEAEDAPRDGIGVWIKLSETLITLEPGESREVPFTITIPQDADVGEHSGGIIIQKSKVGEVSGSSGASIVTRVGIRVYETVPGEILKEIEIVDFNVQLVPSQNQKPSYDITLVALNKGNVSLKPKANLEISGWGKIDYKDFEDISFKKIKMFFAGQEGFPIHFFTGETLSKDWQLLRDQKVTTRWQWPQPEFGRFTFKVNLIYEGNDGETNLETKTIAITVIPWKELAIIISLFVLIVIFFVAKKLLSSGRGWKLYVVQKNDRLTTIAKQAKISWKKLAKVNKLRKPYSIEPGQKILVPPFFASSQKIKTSTDFGELSPASSGSDQRKSSRRIVKK
ncbi:MAG: hypothetical protein A2731_01035 [Candidatus Buchananbacteria bacterium RIFCSPHIGHO2_01_FULL_39_8]|uniref:LysM domain-containing protein n=1 Tax=Candidatus Buchananbacteria bacterium RIFCSPHIGHO2_01_FULL_39_8 TaxID=1797533 RepID=A0A1G1XU20_9BACT|nr:MAG: hypothetical protein A2731_01035 [Candidatus Buchananbacteria bacterium RIFCSPHIGHO2_01_FULL_39_8]